MEKSCSYGRILISECKLAPVGPVPIRTHISFAILFHLKRFRGTKHIRYLIWCNLKRFLGTKSSECWNSRPAERCSRPRLYGRKEPVSFLDIVLEETGSVNI